MKHKYISILLYGVSLALLIFLLKWFELRFLIIEHSFELYIGLIALFFTGLGIWLALKISRPKVKTVVIEKQIIVPKNTQFTRDDACVATLEISKRELEILELMSRGLSNEEIAEKLFVSLSTVKSHNQNLFSKLDVKRRTQAVDKAKRLNLIA